MDHHSPDFVNSILQETKLSSNPSLFAPSSHEVGWLDSLKQMSWTSWVLIILILAFLGLNVFVYLAKGTDWVTQLMEPVTKFFFGTTAHVGGQIVDVSAEGAKEVVKQTAGVAENTLSAIQDITPNKNVKGTPYIRREQGDVLQNTPLHQEINGNQFQSPYHYGEDEADSSIQKTGKAGWCYVGSDRGFRSCAKVGIQDTCLSGDIFPSHDICINPTLRP